MSIMIVKKTIKLKNDVKRENEINSEYYKILNDPEVKNLSR